MLKYIIAAVVAFTPTAASAQMMITSGRQSVLTEAAKTICRSAMETKGNAGDIFDRETVYLRLNADEKLYMLSLCVLYAQGRVDEARSRR